jgi:hypothetical protein
MFFYLYFFVREEVEKFDCGKKYKTQVKEVSLIKALQ